MSGKKGRAGRKPLFGKAMTGAERQRRHRLKAWGPDPWWSKLDLMPIEALMVRSKPVRGRLKGSESGRI